MAVKVIPADAFGWKLEVDGEIKNKHYQAKINALKEAEDLADDVEQIEVQTIDGEEQEYSTWQSLKSTYSSASRRSP